MTGMGRTWDAAKTATGGRDTFGFWSVDVCHKLVDGDDTLTVDHDLLDIPSHGKRTRMMG